MAIRHTTSLGADEGNTGCARDSFIGRASSHVDVIAHNVDILTSNGADAVDKVLPAVFVRQLTHFHEPG